MKRILFSIMFGAILLISSVLATDIGIAVLDHTVTFADSGTSVEYDTLYFRTDLIPSYSGYWRSYWIKFDTLVVNGADSNLIDLVFEYSPLSAGLPWKTYDSVRVSLVSDSIVEAPIPVGGLSPVGNFYGVTWNGQYYANIAKRIALDSTSCGHHWRVRAKSSLVHPEYADTSVAYFDDLWRTRVGLYIVGHNGD